MLAFDLYLDTGLQLLDRFRRHVSLGILVCGQLFRRCFEYRLAKKSFANYPEVIFHLKRLRSHVFYVLRRCCLLGGKSGGRARFWGRQPGEKGKNKAEGDGGGGEGQLWALDGFKCLE